MEAPRPLTNGDVMFAVGKLSRSAGFDATLGRITIAKDPMVAVFDMAASAASSLIKFSQEQNLESIKFSLCTVVPPLQFTGGVSSSFFVPLSAFVRSKLLEGSLY